MAAPKGAAIFFGVDRPVSEWCNIFSQPVEFFSTAWNNYSEP